MTTTTAKSDQATKIAQAIMANRGSVSVRTDEAYRFLTVTFPSAQEAQDAKMAIPGGVGLEGGNQLLVIHVPLTDDDPMEIVNRPYRVRLHNIKGLRADIWAAFDCPARAAQYMYYGQRKMFDTEATATAPDGKGGRRSVTRPGLTKLYGKG